MRIAFITYTFPPQIGGMQKWSHQMAEAYALAGHKVDVFHLVRGLSNHHSELYRYIPVYIDKKTDQSKVPVQYYSPAMLFTTLWFFIKNLKSLSGYDIWQITVGEPQLLRIIATVLSLFFPVTLIAASGNVIFRSKYNKLTRPIKSMLARFVLDRAKRILVDGIDIRDECVEEGIPSEKIIVCYAGVDTEKFKPQSDWNIFADYLKKNKLPFNHDVQAIFYSCRFSWENAPDVFLKAVDGLEGLQAVMIGNGSMMSELQMQASKIKMPVHFWGTLPYDELPTVYPFADICLYPFSKYIGGISQVIPLSMACGAVVITTDIGDNRALIRNGENGFLVPEKDIGAMQRIVKDILHGRIDAGSIRQNARKTIVDKWSVDKRNREYAEIIRCLQ